MVTLLLRLLSRAFAILALVLSCSLVTTVVLVSLAQPEVTTFHASHPQMVPPEATMTRPRPAPIATLESSSAVPPRLDVSTVQPAPLSRAIDYP
jgi:hypothetical protein